ncbi:hypothetical protein FRC14_003444 [Serendipita sp. 396]|nr:hypothetical protein FRC14_003444 [Serendipita sp. 396]KAG8866091.1 hypothetical protein FRC20_009084 [Serendipita sp. 405]
MISLSFLVLVTTALPLIKISKTRKSHSLEKQLSRLGVILRSKGESTCLSPPWSSTFSRAGPRWWLTSSPPRRRYKGLASLPVYSAACTSFGVTSEFALDSTLLSFDAMDPLAGPYPIQQRSSGRAGGQ